MKILLVQTSFFGDTILSTAVISGIQSIYPNCELWMMTTKQAAPMVQSDPLIKGVLPYDKRGHDKGITGLIRQIKKIRSMKFDRVYTLHRSYRTAILLGLSGIPKRYGFKDSRFNWVYHTVIDRNRYHHDVLRNLSILFEDKPLKFLNTELRLFHRGKHVLSQNSQEHLPSAQSYVVLVPGSVWKTKMWHAEGFRDIAMSLLARGFKVVIMGAPSEAANNSIVTQGLPVIDFTGKTSIPDAMYIIQHARLVICNDSMSLHMASAFKVPTVAIFCATSPSFGFYPWKNQAIIVEKHLACKPCSRHGTPICPNGTNHCIEGLSAEEVLVAVDRLLRTQFHA
ncbi:MAG: lipopolysaccharide heptosyltransferase II [Desulfobacterales bacterium]|nr:lipopolysaccharide heptosyltransferase II [Desulfobacterales bacterium]